MAWRFRDFTLDPARAELAGPQGPIHLERHTLDVLIHLVRNADRVVSRDELLEAVWNGRIVSDATISTAIKHARRAVGDTGAEQTLIRTIHRRGFRFVGEAMQIKRVATGAAASAASAQPPRPELGGDGGGTPDRAGANRPSLAILRFQSLNPSLTTRHLADAFPAELITSLSRIGWLHMIARASSFQFDPATAEPAVIGERLGVRYLATGMVELTGDVATLTVDVLQASDGALIMTERFAFPFSEIHLRRADVVSAVASAIELTLPEHEARMARRLSADEFDAWSHYHIGLAHLYRFNAGDNLIAQQHFEAATTIDPDFARAYAGLSFVHWQTAFMQFSDDRRMLLDGAMRTARRALEIDPKEPFAAFNLGRAHWLAGDLDGGVAWIERSLLINPNSAQSTYCSGLVQLMSGVADRGRSMCEKALSLSPLDPMSYAMHATSSMAAIMVDDFLRAQRLAEQAVNTPGAHFYIAMIAAAAYELGGAPLTAERYRDRALAQKPDASADVFFQAFPYQRHEDKERLRGAFRRLGLG